MVTIVVIELIIDEWCYVIQILFGKAYNRVFYIVDLRHCSEIGYSDTVHYALLLQWVVK